MNNYIWHYIDTKKATIKAVEDYQNIRKIKDAMIKNHSGSDELGLYRLQQVEEFLNWFEPAWNLLNDNYKLILKEFYMTGNLKSGAGIRLQFKLNYSERQIHRIRSNALTTLSKLLFVL